MHAFLWNLALATASVANVPPGQATTDRDAIEIIGKAPPAIRREAEDYVHQLGIANGERAAGRWLDPICPHSIGLDPEKSALVEQQVRALAETIGAPVAKSKCKANFLVVFTDDPKGLARTIFRKAQLGSDSIGDRKELENGEEPIRWWYSSEARTRDGSPPGVISPALQVETSGSLGGAGGAGGLAGALPGNDRTISLTKPGSSIVSTEIMRAINHATIVIDVHGANGKSLKSVVDYAALVGLAEVRLGATAPNSILGLFGSGPNIGELTVTDQAFLKALYSMNLDRKAEQHRRVLIGQIIRARTQN